MKQLLRIASRLAFVCILLSSITGVVHAWDDYDWYDEVVFCSTVPYNDAYLECISNPENDESYCRYVAGNAMLTCNSGIPWPVYNPEFCTLANYANQVCIAQYGPGSGNQDLGALLTCRNASRIDECQ